MNRRRALGQISVMAATLAGVFPALSLGQTTTIKGTGGPFLGAGNMLAAPWAAWKAAYLSEDGRVVDALQSGASHSESQGYGLYLAATFGDDDAFDRIYAWTEANLSMRADALLAWRWLPNEMTEVPDRNNASDGDLFYAWGLVVRGERDGNEVFLDRARAIAADLVTSCIVPMPGEAQRLALLPAAQGFSTDEGIVINPSYYMPMAMRELARATGEKALAICAADGLWLMREMAQTGLVPDWIELRPQGMFTPVNRQDRSGYEAMRVSLYLIWSGEVDHPAVVEQARAYYRFATKPSTSEDAEGYVTVFDRASGSVTETSKHVGYAAVAALVDCTAKNDRGSRIPLYRTVDQAYYPATLHLMVLIAQITASPECVPI